MEVQGKTFRSLKKKLSLIPNEDSFLVDVENKIFCVADGVTRDPSETLPDIKTLKGQFQFSLNYPRLSPARVAANIFTEVVPQVIKDYSPRNRDELVVYESFKEANHEIRKWNNKNIPNVDYLENDFAGCVGACAVVVNDFVYYGFITDSGVALFDDYVVFKTRTNNEGPDTKDESIWQDERLKNASWRDPVTRKIIRSEYRNNPYQLHSFGVLTGELSAMNYVKRGSWEINRGDNLFVYSDGLEKAIFSRDAVRLIRDRQRDYLDKYFQSQVSSEGTMIHYRH